MDAKYKVVHLDFSVALRSPASWTRDSITDISIAGNNWGVFVKHGMNTKSMEKLHLLAH
jgi:hypothetical protein